MPYYKLQTPEAEAALRSIEAKRDDDNADALRVADAAIAGVRQRGDDYVAEQIARFDRLTVAPDAIRTAVRAVNIEAHVAAAIDAAIERVESFHLQQLPQSYRWTRGSGNVTHRVRPLRRAGIYVPGGRAVYVSTLIMCAVPARIAGVPEIVVATTPAAAAVDALHYACNRLGITEIYAAGGASGIAALALGTATLERVDKIVGPGNQYVTAAKARLVGTVGIDMTAGPTELVIIADDTADPQFVVADLLAQAEHGDDSSVIVVTTSEALARQIPERALTLLATSLDDAVAVANRIAPEHCSIQTRDAALVAERADNCGAIFLGPFSPVAAGDYAAGPNHVLPTSGSARFFSPLGVYDFVKRSNIIDLDASALLDIATYVEDLATLEGLPEHGRSIAARRAACATS